MTHDGPASFARGLQIEVLHLLVPRVELPEIAPTGVTGSSYVSRRPKQTPGHPFATVSRISGKTVTAAALATQNTTHGEHGRNGIMEAEQRVGADCARENRVTIIGAGHVGATTAYGLLQSPVVREILLLDSDSEKAEGEVMDLRHSVPLGPPVAVRTGTYAEAAKSDIVVVTAGAGSKPGESRLDLLERNAPIVRDCVTQLREGGFDGILLVVSNPADVMAHVAQEASGLPPEKVIGSGTLIDTARLRQILGEELKIDPRALNAYIVGEHGDSEVAAFSCAHVAGVPLRDYAKDVNPSLDYNDILRRVRQAAPEVVRRKGNTAFAIASSVVQICEAILRDEHAVLPVSTRLSGQYSGIDGVYLGTPCIVGAGGIEQVIELPLNETERADLRKSADILANAIRSLHEKQD